MGQRGLRGLLNRVQRATGLGNSATAIKEQRLIAVFATQLDNGNQRLVAARVSGDGLTVLAQQDLPAGSGVDRAGSQAQVDYTTRQLLDRLRTSGIGQADQVLVDPRLQNQMSLMQTLATTADLLSTQGLEAGLGRCSDGERQQLQQWLQQPTQPLTAEHPLAELLQQRTASFGRSMPPEQAAVATMVELGVALAVDSPGLS